jgi:hypothetical protein
VRQVHLDWNGLLGAFQMNMPEIRCFLDLEEGHILKLPPGDQQIAMVRADPARYLAIDASPSRIQYQWLDAFIKTVEDPPLHARMEAAVNGKGAFRRFKDILLTVPDERRRWFEFRDTAMRKRIVDWVQEHGLEPLNPPDWDESTEAGPAPPTNRTEDVEAVRDLLITWFDGRDPAEAVSPYQLEELAREIGQQFRVRPIRE